jgi:ribonuclease P protein component
MNEWVGEGDMTVAGFPQAKKWTSACRVLFVVVQLAGNPADNGADALAPNRGGVYEANFSAEHPSAIQEAWVSAPDEYPGWPRGVEVAPGQGPPPPVGLIGRISQKGVFERLSREGTYARHDGLWVSCLQDPSLSRPHVAYAIGRSAGNAVKRNRLRRQLRHLMAARASTLRPAWYLVGVSSGASITPVESRLAAALTLVHNRLDLIKTSPTVTQ